MKQHEMTCVVCGNKFMTSHSRQSVCGDRCRRERDNAQTRAWKELHGRNHKERNPKQRKVKPAAPAPVDSMNITVAVANLLGISYGTCSSAYSIESRKKIYADNNLAEAQNQRRTKIKRWHGRIDGRRFR